MHTLASAASAAPDFALVYRDHHGFVWRTLRHLGVDPGRVDDALQDTFMVVHARLAEFEGRAALRTWLFEIARRVAARYRRTAAREAPRLCVLDEMPGPTALDDGVELAEAADILRVFLDELDRDKSVVFIMAELEQWRVPEIAEALELNLNTVYARLRAARKQLDRVVARIQARDRRPRTRRDVVAAAILAVPPPGSPGAPFSLAAQPTAATPGLVAGKAVIAGKLGLLTTGVVGVTLAAVVALVHGRPGPAPTTAPGAIVDTRTPLDAPRDAASTGLEIVGDLGRGPAELAATSAIHNSRPGDLGHAPAELATAAIHDDHRGDLGRGPAEPATAAIHAGPPGELGRGSPSAIRNNPPTPARRGGPRPADPLAAELALLESARAALVAGDAEQALARVTDHARRFPGSALAQEADATRIEALCRLGDDARAQVEADRFARRYPASAVWSVKNCRR